MVTIHRANSKQLAVSIRCLEYTHQFLVPSKSDQFQNTLLLLRNLIKLSYSKSDNFSLEEILIIARDHENFKRFLARGILRAGRGRAEYRNHLWKLATTEPRLLFKEKLPKTNNVFLIFLKEFYFTRWNNRTDLYFDTGQNQKRLYILRLFLEVFPKEIVEIIISFIPHWSL